LTIGGATKWELDLGYGKHCWKISNTDKKVSTIGRGFDFHNRYLGYLGYKSRTAQRSISLQPIQKEGF